MASKYSVPLRTIAEEHGLEPLHTSVDYATRLLTVADVNRPALQRPSAAAALRSSCATIYRLW